MSFIHFVLYNWHIRVKFVMKPYLDMINDRLSNQQTHFDNSSSFSMYVQLSIQTMSLSFQLGDINIWSMSYIKGVRIKRAVSICWLAFPCYNLYICNEVWDITKKVIIIRWKKWQNFLLSFVIALIYGQDVNITIIKYIIFSK